MDAISFVLEIIRQVPLWAATGIGSGALCLWLGYKIGVAMSWIRERALRQALQHKIPKMLKDAEE